MTDLHPSDWEIMHGRPEPPHRPPVMTAGDMRAALELPDVAGIQLGELELIRRVGVRVRPVSWDTIAPDVQAPRVTATGARFSAVHRAGEFDLRWDATIELRPDGLVYEMDAVAPRDLEYARIGIVVLHPPPVTAGRRFRSRGAASSASGVLPELVGPQLITDGAIQPLVPGFRELEIEICESLAVHFELSGDVFEIEDQRNWTDGSFKTYSTPVGSTLPHRLAAGAHLRQRVALSVRDRRAPKSIRRRPVSGPVPPPPGRSAEAATVQVLGDGAGLLPRFGTTFAPTGRPDDAALAELAPNHLRIEVGDAGASIGALGHAFGTARRIGAGLELALALPPGEPEAGALLARVAAALASPSALDSSLVRVTIARAGEPVTTTATARLVRQHLPGVSLLGGSHTNFAELNREPPPYDAPLDGLVFAANPQVHDRDDRSLMQSPAAQHDAVLTARALPGGRPVHVTPITLLPTGSPRADHRQHTLLAGAWLTASAAALSAAGAATASWFSLRGATGLVADRGAPPSPAYHVLRELASWRGRRLLSVTIDADADTIAAIGSHAGAGPCLLIANLTPDERSVSVSGVGDAARIATLDPRTVRHRHPFATSERPGGRHSEGRLSVTLQPYSVARVG